MPKASFASVSRHRMPCRVFILALGLAAFAACGAVPERELKNARAAVDAARGFEPYAPDAFKKADEALRTALAEIETQKGKTFPSYEHSQELLAECVRAAANAKSAGESRIRAFEVCEGPLGHGEDVLDPSTESYLPRVIRVVSTASAVDMARKLQKTYGEYKGGHFGESYKAHAEAIESRAKKDYEILAYSSEINSLKLVQTALYVDVAVALQVAVKSSQSRGVEAAYKANQAILEDLIKNMSATYKMSPEQRRAVCEVLSAYKGK
ncbi:MAG: hypothetical protein LAO04_14895 [Acidobacteriia bacterium]|nr:hypothetical protein [Terriglobia bacterium]